MTRLEIPVATKDSLRIYGRGHARAFSAGLYSSHPTTFPHSFTFLPNCHQTPTPKFLSYHLNTDYRPSFSFSPDGTGARHERKRSTM